MCVLFSTIADGRSPIAVAKSSKGAAKTSDIHEQTVMDDGSLGQCKGITGSSSDVSEGEGEKEKEKPKQKASEHDSVDASNKRKLITQEPVAASKAKRGKEDDDNKTAEGTMSVDSKKSNRKDSKNYKKDTMVYKLQDVETETKFEDDQEKTVSKTVDMTVYDEVMQYETDDSDESEDNSALIVKGFLEATSSSELPRAGGLRVQASCSIHRQENVQRTVITGRFRCQLNS